MYFRITNDNYGLLFTTDTERDTQVITRKITQRNIIMALKRKLYI